ncbi:hypothetical protein KR084_011456 [Drosophila pseudotakahashii]|nr:hypothetical protein KR084_011456 [Drosophila pseudotakahashii]
MKDLSGRFARWSLQLQGFHFNIEHRKGSENVVADTLSQCVEELVVDPTEVLGFETTEFAGEDYLGLVKDVETNYRLARKLKSLCDHEMAGMKTADKLRVIQEKVRRNLETAYDRSRQRYDQRARNFLAKPGQEVNRRNFVLSDFGKSFNAKFARKFLKARVVKAVGNNAYELEDLQGRHLGVYHAKDIRV